MPGEPLDAPGPDKPHPATGDEELALPLPEAGLVHRSSRNSTMVMLGTRIGGTTRLRAARRMTISFRDPQGTKKPGWAHLHAHPGHVCINARLRSSEQEPPRAWRTRGE